jgi:DHA2 family multidrug resistance protein
MGANDVATAPHLQGGRLWLLAGAIVAATFLEVLDVTVVNVSVPSIAGSLGVSPAESTWAISSYSLASAVLMPLTGWLAKRFGEVRTFSTSFALFIVFSMLCGLASSMPALVFFRLLQGAVSGPLVPLSLTLLISNFPSEKRGMAIALWTMAIALAPIAGPVIGGWTTEHLSWHWVFFLNLPIGVAAWVLATVLLRGRESELLRARVDWIGLFLLIVGVGSFQFVLDVGNDRGWLDSPLVATLSVTALVALTFFVAWELTTTNPAVDLTLFKDRNFMVGVFLLTCGVVGNFGISIVYPLWLQTVLGYPPTWAGLATAPVGLMILVISPLIGKHLHRLGVRSVASFGFGVLAIVAFWFSHFTADVAFDQLLLPRVIQGIGVGCFFISMNQIVLSRIEPARVASATGLSNFFRTLAGSVSTALTVLIWQDRALFHKAVLSENVTASATGATSYMGALADVGAPADTHLAFVDNLLTKQALTLAVNDVFYLYSCLFACLAISVWLAARVAKR